MSFTDLDLGIEIINESDLTTFETHCKIKRRQIPVQIVHDYPVADEAYLLHRDLGLDPDLDLKRSYYKKRKTLRQFFSLPFGYFLNSEIMNVLTE